MSLLEFTYKGKVNPNGSISKISTQLAYQLYIITFLIILIVEKVYKASDT